MTTSSTNPTQTPTATSVEGHPTAVRDIGSLAAGAGALGFAGTVLLQNALRAQVPANDAPVAEVTGFFARHAGLDQTLVVTFVVGGLCLSVFVGGIVRRLVTGPRPGWAFTGLLGAAGILALFSTLVALQTALDTVASQPTPSPGPIEALWALHNAVFAVLLLSIGLATLGLGLSAASAGIAPRAFNWLAPLGFGLLALAAAAAPINASGASMIPMALGGLGFLVWLGFLTTAGIRLVRGH